MMHSRFSMGDSSVGSESLILVRHLPDNHATIRQWAVLHAVVCCGSYTSAAEVLHISQPAVSYIISRLEEQIGISLLKMEGRRAKITDCGMALVHRSEALLQEAVELETFIRGLRSNAPPGIEPVFDHSLTTAGKPMDTGLSSNAATVDARETPSAKQIRH